jgi:hypothetical protein
VASGGGVALGIAVSFDLLSRAPPALAGDPPEASVFDCVDILHVPQLRGHHVANVQRFGESTPSLRQTARVADLAPAELSDFCDWEACIRADGYGHTCWVADAGWERCRVCDGGDDCAGFPVDHADCVAHARDPGRAPCHVGLLEECLIQRALRGAADPRTTQTCELSAQACAGSLPGDRTADALAAQHETDQVTVEVASDELDLASRLQPDSSFVASWRSTLAAWDGGLPVGAVDAAAAADAVAVDP